MTETETMKETLNIMDELWALEDKLYWVEKKLMIITLDYSSERITNRAITARRRVLKENGWVGVGRRGQGDPECGRTFGKAVTGLTTFDMRLVNAWDERE